MLIKSDAITSQAGQNLISINTEEEKHEERLNNGKESQDEEQDNNFRRLPSQCSER